MTGDYRLDQPCCPRCGSAWPTFGFFDGSNYGSCERCGWTDAPAIVEAHRRAQSNHYAPDGYRYGVMFYDGSVRHIWNGKTQRQRAEEEAALLDQEYHRDNIHPVRRAYGSRVWTDYTV
jgi:hypothetical protein